MSPIPDHIPPGRPTTLHPGLALKPVYTMAEVGALLSISPDTVGDMIRDHRMGCVRDGRLVRVTRRQLETYVRGLEDEQPIEPMRAGYGTRRAG